MLKSDDHAQSQDIAYRSLVGSPVIDFAARSTMGEVRLSAFAGRWVLVFCHPADLPLSARLNLSLWRKNWINLLKWMSSFWVYRLTVFIATLVGLNGSRRNLTCRSIFR